MVMFSKVAAGRAKTQRSIALSVRCWPQKVCRGYYPLWYLSSRFPAFGQNGARVVHRTLSSIANYHDDSARVYLMGQSAGAHIAAMLALDDHYLLAGSAPGASAA
jgi:hypothetical protein